MTRIIKAKDILPGMTIRWGYGDVSYQCPIARVELFNGGQDVQGETMKGQTVLIQGGKDVLVVKEPPHPEEPTEFGARAVVNGRRFLRAPEGEEDYCPWLEEGKGIWYDWDNLLRMGPVTVVPDQGWTVPDTPEVPERIDEWDTWEDVPEGVAVAKPMLWYRYRKIGGKNEAFGPTTGGEWVKTEFNLWDHPGKWSRVSDA